MAFNISQVLVATLATLGIAGGLHAQPTIALDTLRVSLPTELRIHAEALYAADAGTRADAACELGRLHGAAEPVIPLLVALLGDTTATPLVECRIRQWAGRSISIDQLDDRQRPPTSPGEEAARALARIGRAALSPTLAALNNPAWGVRMNAGSGRSAGSAIRTPSMP